MVFLAVMLGSRDIVGTVRKSVTELGVDRTGSLLKDELLVIHALQNRAPNCPAAAVSAECGRPDFTDVNARH